MEDREEGELSSDEEQRHDIQRKDLEEGEVEEEDDSTPQKQLIGVLDSWFM